MPKHLKPPPYFTYIFTHMETGEVRKYPGDQNSYVIYAWEVVTDGIHDEEFGVPSYNQDEFGMWDQWNEAGSGYVKWHITYGPLEPEFLDNLETLLKRVEYPMDV